MNLTYSHIGRVLGRSVTKLHAQTLGATVVLLWLLACLLPYTLRAQELNAKVSINKEQVANTKTEVFEALETKLTQFLNERTWTEMPYRENERIQCSFALTVNSYKAEDNTFSCSLTVTCIRPVYNSSYTSTIFAYEDGDVEFTFQEFDQLEWHPEQIDNNLTAIFAFYAYYFIGLDMDSFAPMGGTEVLRTVQDICNSADGMGAKGWKAFGDTKNRYALVNDYVDGAMEPLRQMQYIYYRKGLDQMADNVTEGRTAIVEALRQLKAAQEAKTMSSLPVIFSDIKRDELVSIFSKQATAEDRTEAYDILSKLNPSQSTYWDKIKQ